MATDKVSLMDVVVTDCPFAVRFDRRMGLDSALSSDLDNVASGEVTDVGSVDRGWSLSR